MGTEHHTAWTTSTRFRASEMNAPLAELDDAIEGLTTCGIGIGYQSTDKPTAAAEISVLLPHALTIPTDLAGTTYYAATGPAAQAVVIVKKNGTQFATITVSAGATTTATLSGTATTFAAGDRLSFVFPSSQDTNWAGVSLTVVGVR